MIKLFKGESKPKDIDFLLLTLLSFNDSGNPEVDLTDLLESILAIKKDFNLHYHFTPEFHYSHDAVDDLDELNEKGYVDKYEFSFDSLLARTMVSLTDLGYQEADTKYRLLSLENRNRIAGIVNNCIESSTDAFRYYVDKEEQ